MSRQIVPIGHNEMIQLTVMAAVSGRWTVEEGLWNEDVEGYFVKIRTGDGPADWRGFSDYLDAIGYVNVLNAWHSVDEHWRGDVPWKS